MEVAFALGREGQAVLLHVELCAGWGLLCGRNQEEHRTGQCWAILRLTLGSSVWLPGGRMWGEVQGVSQGQLVRALQAALQMLHFVQRAVGSNAISCAFRKDPSGCPLEDKLEGVRLDA